MDHISIGYRIKKVKSYQEQLEVLKKWKEDWYLDQMNLINRIYAASKRGNYEAVTQLASFMEGMTQNRFAALENIINRVSDPKRVLIDDKPAVSEVPPIDSPSKNEGLDIDEIVKCYNAGMNIAKIAAYNKMSHQKIIKILVTRNVYTSELYDKIKELRLHDISEDEIVERLDISKKILNIYTPYTKGIYKLEDPSDNAAKIREYRKKYKNESRIDT